MSIVAGVDFGTLSVRVSIFDSVSGPSRRRYRRVSAASQEGRSRPRHAEPRRPHARAGRRHAQRHRRRRHRWPRHRSHRARYHRLERHPGRCPPPADRRLLPLVRPPRLAGSRRDHRRRARSGSSKPSTGAAASTPANGASPSSCTGCATIPTSAPRFATALEHCDMVAAVLCGINDPVAGLAQRLRHGPQVDVERRPWAGCPRKNSSPRLDPAARRRPREARRTLRHQRSDRRTPHARMGRAPRTCAPASPFPSAPSTPTGTPSAPASASATWSTWSAPPPASWRSATSPA